MSDDDVNQRFLGAMDLAHKAEVDRMAEEERADLATVELLNARTEIAELQDAIRWLCTEMPVGWQEVAVSEDRAEVVATVQCVIERGFVT